MLQIFVIINQTVCWSDVDAVVQNMVSNMLLKFGHMQSLVTCYYSSGILHAWIAGYSCITCHVVWVSSGTRVPLPAQFCQSVPFLFKTVLSPSTLYLGQSFSRENLRHNG